MMKNPPRKLNLDVEMKVTCDATTLGFGHHTRGSLSGACGVNTGRFSVRNRWKNSSLDDASNAFWCRWVRKAVQNREAGKARGNDGEWFACELCDELWRRNCEAQAQNRSSSDAHDCRSQCVPVCSLRVRFAFSMGSYAFPVRSRLRWNVGSQGPPPLIIYTLFLVII